MHNRPLEIRPPRPVFVAMLGLALFAVWTPFAMSLGLLVIGLAVWMDA